MQISQTLKKAFHPIHPEGYPFVAILASVTFCAAWFSAHFFWIGVIVTAWCMFFFRDPCRVTPLDNRFIVSSADGIISSITKVCPPSELGLGSTEMIRISVFMSIFSCHINRSPVQGKITHMHYVPGKFFNADLDKASTDNERNCLVIEHEHGKVGVVQIAGLIARRIVSWKKIGFDVNVGERFGLIRFGSRVDVFMPTDVQLRVAAGQVSVGGETVLAEFLKDDPSILLTRVS